ncbi:hypothetical protein Q2941_18520 [Bradyrhizobium sp. UFLA05-153]
MVRRPEVTGKKVTATGTVIAKKKATDKDIESILIVVEEFYKNHTNLDAYSIEEFCRRHSISVAFYYKLRDLGLTPREMEKGARVLITREAAADWRRDGVMKTAMKQLGVEQKQDEIAEA